VLRVLLHHGPASARDSGAPPRPSASDPTLSTPSHRRWRAQLLASQQGLSTQLVVDHHRALLLCDGTNSTVKTVITQQIGTSGALTKYFDKLFVGTTVETTKESSSITAAPPPPPCSRKVMQMLLQQADDGRRDGEVTPEEEARATKLGLDRAPPCLFT
jgi:hypothetical protein